MWTIVKKFVALPAYLSSLLSGWCYPCLYEINQWNGRFDLEYMYARGYVFGAIIWALIVLGVCAVALVV